MARRGLPMLHGILPLRRTRVPIDMLAGVTLAALSIPEVLGYAKIAGMPVVTGLYTLLLPMAVFAVLGSSRHLVVGADSATAAILAAGLVGVAAVGSTRYVQLAGLAALMAGALLLLARVTRLGFLADFLSRTVLVGFLTGVGIEVALGQLPDMLGVPKRGRETVSMIVHTVRELGQAQLNAILVAAGVIVIVVGVRLLNPRVPGGLIAVVAAITVSWAADLAAKGIHVVGSVPRGLPDLTVPTVHWHDVSLLFGVAASMFAVILAQSAATSRAYAARYEEEFTEDVDLTGLGGANIAAAFTGTFVVNGSPTKTQMVDGAGGRSQLSQLTAGAIVLLVLVLVTKPLEYLPTAALAAVVFLIGLQLIDVRGLRRLYAVRRAEFAVAVLTTLAVVLLGVEQGVILAVLASMVDHLRHSYSPHNSVLVKSAAGHWQSVPVTKDARTTPGLVIYRFGTSLYFANAARLVTDIVGLIGDEPPRWFCLDGAAIGDVDYSAASVLLQVCEKATRRGSRVVLSNIIVPVRHQLDRYGITDAVGADAYFATAGEALEAFQAHHPELSA